MTPPTRRGGHAAGDRRPTCAPPWPRPTADPPTGVDYLGLVQAAHDEALSGPISYRGVPLFGGEAQRRRRQRRRCHGSRALNRAPWVAHFGLTRTPFSKSVAARDLFVRDGHAQGGGPHQPLLCEVAHDGRRFIVAMSAERLWRDTRRTAELVARTSKELRALELRVGAERLKDKAKIAAAASRILSESGVARLFDVEIGEGRFLYHYDEAALDYEEKLLAGRWVVTTSLTPEQASAGEIVVAYRRLLEAESTFRVLKDLIELRPVFHWTEDRVRAHVAVCVLAAVIEALWSSWRRTLPRANGWRSSPPRRSPQRDSPSSSIRQCSPH